MNILHYLKKQKKNLIHEFKNNMSTCLIAMPYENINRHALQYNWEISYLEHIKPTSAVIIQKPSMLPELWINRTYTRYRHAFIEYLKQYYQYTDKLPSTLQVDHLQSTYRFKKDHPQYFIRLYLIERTINTSYGAGFEKSFYKNERNTIPKGGIHMDWITFLKVYGVKLPSKQLSPDEWSSWTWLLALELDKNGIEDALISYHGISTVLNLGYRGKYTPFPIPLKFKNEILNHPLINLYPSLVDR